MYNKYEGGVDLTDQVTKKFSCQRATRRWSKALFENLVDIAIHNAHVMFTWANPMAKITKREFIEWLAKQMAIAHVETRRKTVVGLHTDVVNLMDNFLLNFSQKYGPTTRPTASCNVCSVRTNLFVCARCKSAVFCTTHYLEKKFYRCADCCDVTEGEVKLKSGIQRCNRCQRHLDKKTPVYCHNCGDYMCALHKKTVVHLKLCGTCSTEASPKPKSG